MPNDFSEGNEFDELLETKKPRHRDFGFLIGFFGWFVFNGLAWMIFIAMGLGYELIIAWPGLIRKGGQKDLWHWQEIR